MQTRTSPVYRRPLPARVADILHKTTTSAIVIVSACLFAGLCINGYQSLQHIKEQGKEKRRLMQQQQQLSQQAMANEIGTNKGMPNRET